MRDILTLATAPTVEPISVAQAKVHCRVEVDDDDTLIAGLITAARQYAEQVHRRALVNQTWRLTLDQWPARDYINLPKEPLASVTSVAYTDADGNAQTLASSNYVVSTDLGRLTLKKNINWPTPELYVSDPIRITFVVGYGATAASVPQTLRQAMLLLIGHWYENREQVVVTGAVPKDIPMGVDTLLMTDRAY